MYEATADAARERVATWESELETTPEQGYDDPTHPRFGNDAVLKMGLDSRRVSLDWAAWLASTLRSRA